jgi:hypothetical protein
MGAPIAFDAASYPYWFKDTDGSGGECDDGEDTYANAWADWSPRLLRAAYNYQMTSKDPGKHAHNAKYAIELVYDSIMDLNDALSSPEDLDALTRNDPGHFNGAGEAARHWDEDEAISSSCSRCHGGAPGLEFYIEYGVGLEDEEADNGLECETCHTDIPTYETIRSVASVTFPSDVEIDEVAGGGSSNLCATCHQGRESKTSVDERIATGKYAFLNIHYLPAASTYMGSEAGVGYEYDGMDYSGPWAGDHLGGGECIDCHDPAATEHSFKPDDIFGSVCSTCHRSLSDVAEIKASSRSKIDYDGDGDGGELLEEELAGMADMVQLNMQSYADSEGLDIPCYNGDAYPYWFTDADGSGGSCDSGETTRYGDWDPTLMKAAFNFQMEHKEPGAWAHNFDYMAQLLYDSVDDLGGDTSDMVRPDAD